MTDKDLIQFLDKKIDQVEERLSIKVDEAMQAFRDYCGPRPACTAKFAAKWHALVALAVSGFALAVVLIANGGRAFAEVLREIWSLVK